MQIIRCYADDVITSFVLCCSDIVCRSTYLLRVAVEGDEAKYSLRLLNVFFSYTQLFVSDQYDFKTENEQTCFCPCYCVQHRL